MARILFAPFSIAGGLIAGFIGKKLFEFVWARFDDEEPPESEIREIDTRKMIAAMAIQGAIFRAVKGIADHQSRKAFEKGTGTWPGKVEPAAK